MPSSAKHNSLGELYLQSVRGRRATPATVNEMVEAWLAHCRRTYPNPNGSGTLSNMQMATRPLVELFGDLPLDQLSIDHLEAVRDRMIETLSRRSINDRMARLRTMMRHFGPLIKVEDLTLSGLRKGRSSALESKRKLAVSVRDVLRTLKDPNLHPHVKAMCLVQLRTGIRPGEVVTLRGSEIDTSTSPWVCRPEEWKGSWREKDRVIAIGPRAQLILLPYLNDGYLFTMESGPRKGQPWRVMAYCRAISRAAERQCVPHWTPQQLRKRALTDAPTEELARQIAQHDDIKTTRKHYLDPVLPQDVAEYAQTHG